MATASKPLGGNTNYVFKMQYDAGGSAPMHRRYGYAGELALPQVYEGLHERASQTFSIARENVVIRVRDNLGNPHLHLDSYQAFLRHVYMPLQQRPHEAKIDEKKRIVLAFVVLDREKAKRRLAELEAEAKTLRAKIAESERQRAKAAEAKAKKEKLERQAALAKEQAKVRAQHASARPAAAAAVAAATAAKNSRTVQHADSAPKPKVVEATKPAQRTPEPARAVESAPSKSTPAASPTKPAAVIPPPQADRATAWTGVQGLLETFVENLNAHLADTFGDSAVPLDFKQLAEKKLGPTSNKSVEANKSAEANEPANKSASAGTRAAKPVYHPSVFCDGCNEDLFGPRYKCLDCSNYDLCGACMDQRDSHHAALHAFAEIRFPGDKHHETTRGSTRQPPPARHAATCNLCDKTIFGARYKCLECPDFDLDSECYDTNVRALHPGHKFVRLQSPRDYVVPSVAPPLAPRHRHVRCDGCQREPIVGVRYRCMHPSCADYDLCADCEALPIPVHPHDHPLLKIRQPLDPWTDRAKVTVARDRARTLVARRESVLLGPASADGGADGGPSAAPVVDGASDPVDDASSSPVDDGPGSDTTADTVLDKLVAAADTTADTVLDKLVAAAVSVQDAAAGTVAPESGAEENNREVAPEDAVEEDSPAAEEQEELSATDTTAPAPTDSVSQQPDHSSPLSLPHATFVSDITLLDGIAVPAGAEFQKVWAVRAGPAGWPAGCRLVHVGGFSSKYFAGTATTAASFDVAAAAPNEVVSVSCDCKAPEDSGRFMDFWRLALPDGTLFGERLWIDLTIESEPVASLSSSSSSVLFMAPSLDAQGQAAAPSSTVASNLSEFESVVRSVGADSQAFSSESVSALESDSEEDFVFLSGDSEGSEL